MLTRIKRASEQVLLQGTDRRDMIDEMPASQAVLCSNKLEARIVLNPNFSTSDVQLVAVRGSRQKAAVDEAPYQAAS